MDGKNVHATRLKKKTFYSLQNKKQRETQTRKHQSQEKFEIVQIRDSQEANFLQI